MNDVIQVHVEFYGKTHRVGYLRYHSKAHRPSSLFEYTDSWLSHRVAFALDPANLELTTGQHYLTSEKLHYQMRSETAHLTAGDGN